MRKAVVGILLILLTGRVFTQSLTDDFSDGEITSDPSWTGDTDQFLVNASQQLQLQGDCDAGGINYLTLAAATSDSVVWEFYTELDFDPSSSNHMRFYLQSDAADLGAALHGYYIRIGEDGTNDAVKLYRQDGTGNTLLLSGETGAVAAAPAVRVRVIRNAEAVWHMLVDYTGGTSFTDEGSVTDNTYNTGYYTGVYCQYTSTRCDAFYFDDIYISPLYEDDEPPVLLSAAAISDLQVKAIFNEPLQASDAENGSNYTVDGGVGNPIDAALQAGGSSVVLTFADDLPAAVLLHLEVNGIADLAGNVCGLQSQPFTNFSPGLFDLLITEIMADPEPVQELPAAEYIEIWNATPFPVNLEGWTIRDPGTTSQPFPAVVLEAGAYLIVCSAGNTAEFEEYGDVLGVGSFPALNNTGDSLYLFDADEELIHSVYYTDSWYADPIKENGGYSLEMIDTGNPCQEEANWIASIELSGGTPGQENSVAADNPDVVSPSLVSVFPSSATSLYITFDEYILTEALTTAMFAISPDIGSPLSVSADPYVATVIELPLPEALEPGITYTLTCTGLADCSGNAIGVHNSLEFGLPETPGSGDVIINEVLFNPATGSDDFVEIYNNSNHFIQLNQLRLTERNVENAAEVLEYCYMGEYGRLLAPGAYFFITEKVSWLAPFYDIEPNAQFSENSQCPNFPDDEGIVSLELSSTGVVLDQLHYYDDWHYPLLEDDNGVSLERLRFDAPTQQAENWHSAAEAAGYATPGRLNSVVSSFEGNAGTWTLESEVFSPDGDGYQDLMVLTYTQPAEGTSASLSVFNLAGQLVAIPARNLYLGVEGLLVWDGLDDSGKQLPTGIYILYVEEFDLTGRTDHFKFPVTLARKQ